MDQNFARAGAPWRYILSAGRTGTVFLENFLNAHCPGAVAVHEPSPSRQHLMLANLRNDWGLGHGLLAWHFQRSRLRRLAAHDGHYVEINPHLCPLSDLLPDPARELRVVHMVREPASWTTSMLGFRASTRFRDLIAHIPFATPYPAPRPAGWRRMDEAERTLWRWHWCNSRLRALKELTPYYCLVRYEDLFAEGDRRASALGAILATLGIEGRGAATEQAFRERQNPTADLARPPPPEMVRRICGDLAGQLGYRL